MRSLWKGRTARRRRGAAGWNGKSCDDWVYRDNAGGLAGLSNRTAPGRTPYLSAAQKAELYEIVRAGPDPEVDRVVRWRRIDLKHLIKERFAVVMHECTVGKQLAETWVQAAFGAPRTSSIGSGSTGGVQTNFDAAFSGCTAG